MKQTPTINQNMNGRTWKEYSPRELLEITTKMFEIRFEQNRLYRQTTQFTQRIMNKACSLYFIEIPPEGE